MGKVFGVDFQKNQKSSTANMISLANIKAYTKAFTRACKKLLPQDLMMAAVYKLARLVPADWQPRQALPEQRQARALPPAQNGADAETTQTAEKAAFASYNDRAEQLEKLGITKEVFWEGVKAHFKVKSRAEMTAEQYQQLRKDLNEKDFAQWIRDLAPKKTETKTAETEKEADPQF